MGDRPLNRVGLKNYRRLIGTVMQDDRLFSGSIADNISFFSPEPDVARIESCARQAAIHKDIVEMPMGYETLVSNLGSGLSGGQVQRVLLARALYKEPRILVLDEATAHLDSESELAVQQALSVALEGRMSLVIAHRLSTIREADQILVIESGQVAETGTHEELLAAGGLYADLYLTQFKSQENQEHHSERLRGPVR